MDPDIQKAIDNLWNSSLLRVSKKEAPVSRPGLGDYIDLLVPQERILSMLEANPALASLIYYSAYSAASRNAYMIMRKLNMPADYFWKYEHWPKERAFSVLQRINNRVFTAIMNENKEGMLELADVNVERLHFIINFKECVECAGVSSERSLCYYHAGTFAGIIAGLLGKDMDGYETSCTATGQSACVFLIGKRDDPEIGVSLTDFLAPKRLGVKIDKRLRENLRENVTRSLGNMVNIEYYQLMVINSIASNPSLFSASSFNIGLETGSKLSVLLKATNQDNPFDAVKDYYGKLHYLELNVLQQGKELIITLNEIAEIPPSLQKKELLGFLLGELQGLFSGMLGSALVCKGSWFEGSLLKVTLSPQV
jgi:hypothetical protein